MSREPIYVDSTKRSCARNSRGEYPRQVRRRSRARFPVLAFQSAEAAARASRSAAVRIRLAPAVAYLYRHQVRLSYRATRTQCLKTNGNGTVVTVSATPFPVRAPPCWCGPASPLAAYTPPRLCESLAHGKSHRLGSVRHTADRTLQGPQGEEHGMRLVSFGPRRKWLAYGVQLSWHCGLEVGGVRVGEALGTAAETPNT